MLLINLSVFEKVLLDPFKGLSNLKKKSPSTLVLTTIFKFCNRLFQDRPHYQRFFKAFEHIPIEKLSGSDKFQAHALTVMYSFTSFIDSLDSPEVLRELVYRTARNHNSRGVYALQFEVGVYGYVQRRIPEI